MLYFKNKKYEERAYIAEAIRIKPRFEAIALDSFPFDYFRYDSGKSLVICFS